ncbi:peptide ABC transporter substrate-binding protein [Miniphocaeibacter massiliensis]|uniref:peptide ABC transporter substrate-binding protein n=1 Tax=Miniphocaeibacter massiliensis TaxID=2041841 RepID=UPI000C1C53CF|nr:peptide ABC transporter substrate-binding protein [Miniphocaeibacter massiliensis]
MKSKKISILAIMLALMLTITACGGKGTDSTGKDGKKANKTTGEQIVKVNNNSEPVSLDPALGEGTHQSWILQHTFEGLMGYDEKGEIVPAAAEDFPKISEDGLVYTFKLKEGSKWSNGDPLTAKDFEYSWKRALDPKLAAYYAYQFYYIKGGKAYNEGKGSVEDVGVKAIDDLTLEVTLEHPTTYFTELTGFYPFYPVNEKVASGNADWANGKDINTYVSNGPFKMTKWAHNDIVSVRKNENYRDADKVKIDGIDFDIMEDKNTEWQNYDSGLYDLIVSPTPDVISSLKSEGSKELIIGEDVGLYYYNFNNKIKPFNNVKVREALSMAIDRKSIVDNVAQGEQIPAEGFVPLGLKDDKGKEYRDGMDNLIVEDVKEAKKLLEEGLKEEGMTVADFNKAKFSILYNTNEGHKKIAEAIQGMWKENLGIDIALNNKEFQVKLNDEKEGNFNVSRAGWMADFDDPLTFLELWETSSSFNDAKYSNKEYDSLIASIKTSGDKAKRVEDMRVAEKILGKDLPVMPIYFYTQPRVQKTNLKGVYKTPLNYPTMTYAEFTE